MTNMLAGLLERRERLKARLRRIKREAKQLDIDLANLDAMIKQEEESGPARQLGSKGGIARAIALTPTRRKEIAKKAAVARWGIKR